MAQLNSFLVKLSGQDNDNDGIESAVDVDFTVCIDNNAAGVGNTMTNPVDFDSGGIQVYLVTDQTIPYFSFIFWIINNAKAK